METKKTVFGRNFTLMVIGQIISLFGNNILRFALPLYLFSETGSATLLGVVSAVSFIPMVLLSPVGGIVADRVNKRNVMVILDFATTALVLIFTLLLGQLSLVPLMVITLMFLYGIQGAYQPAVQASIPALMQGDQIVTGNAVINAVNSLASLLGPVIGGVVYGFYGLKPILVASIVCFFLSAVMEIFIKIPFKRQPSKSTVMQTVKSDLGQSLRFVRKEQPVLWKAMIITALFNLFLSAMLMVGTLVIITKLLGFSETLGEQLYGYTQGALAAGGLAGGLFAGVLSKKLDITKGHFLLFICGVTILPMVISLILLPAMATYIIITVCSFLLMLFATLFSILALSFIQQITPDALIGKVISLVMAVSMCASPAGQALYGALFDWFADAPYVPMLLAAVASIVVAIASKAIFSNLGELRKPATS